MHFYLIVLASLWMILLQSESPQELHEPGGLDRLQQAEVSRDGYRP